MSSPRVVIVTRSTEYDELVAQHGTRRAVAFFLEQRGENLDVVDEAHRRHAAMVAEISASVPASWRRALADRSDLDRWLFEDDDLIVTVGQDGLVANVAKYLDGQPVVGINSLGPTGPLARLEPVVLPSIFEAFGRRGRDGVAVEKRTMVEARADDGRSLRALNEVYVGNATHQSVRYELRRSDGAQEGQSSSGVLVGTGTGSTGWCASLWSDRRPGFTLPAPSSAELSWFVREAWPSVSTGASLCAGLLEPGDALELSMRSDGAVVFGDGVESDRLDLRWGQRITVSAAPTTLALATGDVDRVRRPPSQRRVVRAGRI